MTAHLRFILVWAGLVLAQTASAGEAGFTLTVTHENGQTIFTADLAEGDGWCLHWNHSVAGFLVRECYRVERGRMTLERAHQPDFAAGLGHIPGRGEMVAAPEGGYWIENINEAVPGDCYVLRAGSAAVDHRIVLDGAPTEYSLSAHAQRQRVSIALAPQGAQGEREC